MDNGKATWKQILNRYFFSCLICVIAKYLLWLINWGDPINQITQRTLFTQSFSSTMLLILQKATQNISERKRRSEHDDRTYYMCKIIETRWLECDVISRRSHAVCACVFVCASGGAALNFV